MRRFHLLLLALSVLIVTPTIAFAGELSPPWTVLPWGDAPGDPGLLPGGDERPAVGPIALAAAGELVVVSDRVHRQLLRIDASGRVAEVIPTDFVAVDLQLLDGGRIVALDVQGDRVHVMDSPRAWRSVEFGARAALARVAVGPRGRPWVVDGIGRVRSVAHADAVPPVGFERATPLGLGAEFHGTGRVIDRSHGEVLLWRWEHSAEVKPPGADSKLTVSGDGRLIGTLRPLVVDESEVAHVLVETLDRGSRVSVIAEVHRFSLSEGGRELGRTRWAIDDVAPVNRYAAVDREGTLFVMASRPEGLTLWRERSLEPAPSIHQPPSGGVR